jgi:amino acid transporter
VLRYPGAGSSYFFAEQAFLSKTNAYKFARLAKFVIGWASHLYYWVYPGGMVGVTAILAGYLGSQLWPDVFDSGINSPTLMIGFCVLFSFGVAYIAYRGITGTTGVNVAINVIQISALLIFSVIAIGYRLNHNRDDVPALSLSAGKAVPYQVAQEDVTDADGQKVQDKWADDTPKVAEDGTTPVCKTQDRVVKKEDLDARAPLPLPAGIAEGDPFPDYKRDSEGKAVLGSNGRIVPLPLVLSYKGEDAVSDKPGDAKDPETFNFHTSAASVMAPHNFSFVIIQACIAILILGGFESVTSMGEEAKNANRDIPRAVLLSLLIQGVICYLIEYFAAGFFLNSGYKMPTAAGSSAPIGDMMVICGTWLFGSPEAGWWFMIIEAVTVFLALIGTTLSCICTGARVTYAMGRDEEVPSHFGMLHGKRLTPHRAIWTLAAVSAAIGVFAVLLYLCGTTAPDA